MKARCDGARDSANLAMAERSDRIGLWHRGGRGEGAEGGARLEKADEREDEHAEQKHKAGGWAGDLDDTQAHGEDEAGAEDAVEDIIKAADAAHHFVGNDVEEEGTAGNAAA